MRIIEFILDRFIGTQIFLVLVAAIVLLPQASFASYSGALQTILVPATSSAANNGTALLSSLASITDANASKPYLIKLEPGKYDVQQTQLVMKPFVDIVGSGRESTRLLGAPITAPFPYPAVVSGASNSELRDLSVINVGRGPGTFAVGIFLGGVDTRLTNVKSKASGGDVNEGIIIRGANSTVDKVIGVGVGGLIASGIVVEEASSATLLRSDFRASGATDINRAIWVRGQYAGVTTRITTCTAQAIGGERAYGLLESDGNSPGTRISVLHSTIAAMGASVENHGIYLDPGPAFSMLASRASATGTSSYGLRVLNLYETRVHGSTIAGDTGPVLVLVGLGSTKIASSGLYGGSVVGNAICAGVHDDAFTFYSSTCP